MKAIRMHGERASVTFKLMRARQGWFLRRLVCPTDTTTWHATTCAEREASCLTSLCFFTGAIFHEGASNRSLGRANAQGERAALQAHWLGLYRHVYMLFFSDDPL
jgi:hypothetical protein